MRGLATYSVYELKLILDDAVGNLTDALDKYLAASAYSNAPSGYVEEKKRVALGNLGQITILTLSIAKELKKREEDVLEIWQTEHISQKRLPSLTEKMMKAYGDVPELEDLRSMLSWLMYYDLSTDEYKWIYETKLSICAHKAMDDALSGFVKMRVPMVNPIYQHVMTYGLTGSEQYSYPFTSGQNDLDVTQYFIYKVLTESEKRLETQKISFAEEIQDLTKASRKDIESLPSARMLRSCLTRCNTLFEEGYNSERLNTLLVELMNSAEAKDLEADLNDKNRLKKTIAMVLGILAEKGVYKQVTDKRLAERLDFADTKASSVAKYINLGRHNEEKKSYIKWIDNNL